MANLMNQDQEQENPDVEEGFGPMDYRAIEHPPRVDDRPMSVCCTEGTPIRLMLFKCRAPESNAIIPDHRWALFHRDNFAERGFEMEEDADRWLQQRPTWPPSMIVSNVTNEDQGWRGPIPIVTRLSKPTGLFAGPYLRDAHPPANFSGDELLNASLKDCLGDGNFNNVWEAACSLSFTFPLSKGQLRLVLRRADSFSIPTVECRLAENWGFNRVVADVRRWPANSCTTASRGMLEHLHLAAAELETSFLRMLSGVCVDDVYNFWTCLQVHEHLHNLAQRIRGRYSVEIHTDILMRWIGSYTAQFRPPSLTSLTAASQLAESNHLSVAIRRKRGRPAKLSSQAKQRALEAKLNDASAKEVAKILYDVKYPNPEQIKNTYSILDHYRKHATLRTAE